MQNSPALVVMAAGLGSRFGGLKQVTDVGPNRQTLLEYAIYDAARAGFSRAVIVIKREMEAQFRELFGNRIEKLLPLTLVYQDMYDLPDGFSVPEGRERPWGTGHAARAARHVVDTPFAVINADDFYGREAYALLCEHLRTARNGEFAMVGYELRNTMSENGFVSRGVCHVSDGCLEDVVERVHIERRGEALAYTEDGGADWTELAPDTTVSLNFWGFTPDFFPMLDTQFAEFLPAMANPLRSEFYLPFAANAAVRQKKASVRVLRTESRWYGVTYPDDLPVVRQAIRQMTEAGIYPENLFA